MPVGIEGLGQGLLQGYQFGLQQKRLAKQDERQAAQDERQIVQDAALAKSQDIANRTNEFQLQNGQQTAERAEQDRLKSQTLNQAIHNSIMAVNNGDYDAAGKQLVDVNNNPIYGNTFKMNYLGHRDTGKKDEAGKPIVEFNMESVDASGKVHNAWVQQQDITVQTMHQLDPIANYQKQEAERNAAAAKATERKNKIADEITLDDRRTANDIKLERVKAEAARKKAFAELGIKEGALSSTGLKPFTISEVVGKDSFGEDLRRERIDTNQLGRFVRWAEANRIQANDVGSQKWIAAGSPDVDGAPRSDSGAKTDTNALPLPKGLDEPSKNFLSSDVVLPAAKEIGVKPSPKTEKPKSEPAKQGKGNAGTKTPQEYVQSLVNALPVMPPPKTYQKGTTFFSRDAGNPLDRTQKVGTR